MPPKRELWFVAECKDSDGKVVTISVYREGASVLLSPSNFWRRHECHSAVSTQEQVLAEISLVYEVKVNGITDCFDARRQLNAHLAKPTSTTATPAPTTVLDPTTTDDAS